MESITQVTRSGGLLSGVTCDNACYRQRCIVEAGKRFSQKATKGSRPMSKVTQSLSDFLFPPNQRPHWTFRNLTVIVVIASLASVLFRVFVRLSPEQVARLESHNLFNSSLFVSLYYVFLAVVMWLVYMTRNRADWYEWRVFVYGMVLAGALIGLVDIVLPLRSL